MALATTKALAIGRWQPRREHWMSRRIAVHVVAGILFVGVGTTDAQESIPKPAVVEVRDTLTSTGVLRKRNSPSSPQSGVLESRVLFRLNYVAGIKGDLGVTVAIAPDIHIDNPDDNIEGRQSSDRSPQNASNSRQAKTGTTRRWFTGAMLWMLEFLARGVYTSGR